MYIKFLIEKEIIILKGWKQKMRKVKKFMILFNLLKF